MNKFNDEELNEVLQKDSKTLCTIIIANRILGCYKNEYKKCMIELMKRRASGDDFNFENYIKETVDNTKFSFNVPNIKAMKQKVFSSIIESILQSNFDTIQTEQLFGED